MGSTLTRIEAIKAWIDIIKTEPIIYLSIIASPFTILGAVIFGRDQKTGKILYIVNILSAVLFIIQVSITLRYLIYNGYFAPIYPFFILNLMSIPLFIIRKWNVRLVKLLTILTLIYFVFIILVGNFSYSLPMGYTRLMYKNSLTYKAYQYIEENIPSGSKIAHDHHVAIPSDKEITACHFWQRCGTDYIEEFQPDYVIFNEDYAFNGVHPPTARLTQYIKDHHFTLVKTIDSISVWKKPGN